MDCELQDARYRENSTSSSLSSCEELPRHGCWHAVDRVDCFEARMREEREACGESY